MRRTDREVSEPKILDEILRRGRSLHLGLTDEDGTYVVPVNYGACWEKGRRVLYFHGADKGKKMELIRKDPRASFCVTVEGGVRPGETAGNYSFAYESVMGTGRIEILESLSEKRRGLACLFSHYAPEREFESPDRVVEKTAVLRLLVEEISGKHRM